MKTTGMRLEIPPANFVHEYNQLQMHAAVMHDIASVPSRNIDTPWCPVCMLRFDGRGQVLEHIGKTGLCLFNLSRLDFLPVAYVAALQTNDAVARGALVKSGWHKNKVGIPATRMFGP